MCQGPAHYLHAIALYYQLFLVDISAHADIMSDGFRLLLYIFTDSSMEVINYGTS